MFCSNNNCEKTYLIKYATSGFSYRQVHVDEKGLVNKFFHRFNKGSHKPPIPLDGDSATIRNFGQNEMNRSRKGKSAVEAW